MSQTPSSSLWGGGCCWSKLSVSESQASKINCLGLPFCSDPQNMWFPFRPRFPFTPKQGHQRRRARRLSWNAPSIHFVLALSRGGSGGGHRGKLDSALHGPALSFFTAGVFFCGRWSLIPPYRQCDGGLPFAGLIVGSKVKKCGSLYLCGLPKKKRWILFGSHAKGCQVLVRFHGAPSLKNEERGTDEPTTMALWL